MGDGTNRESAAMDRVKRRDLIDRIKKHGLPSGDRPLPIVHNLDWHFVRILEHLRRILKQGRVDEHEQDSLSRGGGNCSTGVAYQLRPCGCSAQSAASGLPA